MNDASLSATEKQAIRFDDESAVYDATHNSEAAQQYRDVFYRNRLFDIPLRGASVLDAMCASGIDTSFLIEKGASVSGLDISSECAKIFEERYERPCTVASVTDTGLNSNSLDVVYISGGLHHVIPMLDEAIAEVHRILKPGGYFCFLEPNADTWANKAREMWYKSDSRFTDEERALSYRSELSPIAQRLGFDEVDFFSGGNVAYVLLQQANIVGSGKLITELFRKPIMAAERVLSVVPGAPHLYFCARWRKQ